MLGPYGAIHVTDGVNGHWLTSSGNIVVRHAFKKITQIIEMNGERIIGHKIIKNGRVQEWERLGRFYKGFTTLHGNRISAPVTLNYHPDTLRALHGIVERFDQKLFGMGGKCRSMYSRGRFLWQEFRYSNRKIAYRFSQSDRKVTIKFPSGKVAAVIHCINGFSSRSTDGEWRGKAAHGCDEGVSYFHKISGKMDTTRQFDFSKDGNCVFTFHDRSGRVRMSGEYRNSQRVGEWVINGKVMFILQGVPVNKKLYETKPEDLKISQVIRLPNAQLRAALMAKIGPERIAKECKYKTVHETKAGMLLMEFPIRVDDGNGGTESRMRILRVKCPTTKGFYYLGVPDFVWDGGKRTKLNTCEQARQWTFGVDNPREKINFAKET